MLKENTLAQKRQYLKMEPIPRNSALQPQAKITTTHCRISPTQAITL